MYLVHVANNPFSSLGMVHSGLGETHVNNFLTSMNLPPISHKTLKKREREVGPIIEKVAEESCEKALAEEVATSEAGRC